MSPSRPFILRPVATSLLMAAIFLVGIVAYTQLPVSALPEVDYPTIQVVTFYPGASPDVVATTVTAPLERQFGQMPGLNQMTSISSGGTAVVVLQFNLSLNIDVAEEEVQSAINASQSLLPANLPSPPVYRKTNPADAPVLTMAVTSKSMPLSQVEDLVDTRLAPKIAQLSGVGLVSISGGQKPAVRIQANPTALLSYGINLEDLRTALTETSVNAAKGNFDGPRQDFQIDANDQLITSKDYRDVVVAYRNGAPVMLTDIARIVDGVENNQQAAWMNETPAVILNVQRQPGAKTISVVKNIKQLLPQLEASLPASIQVTTLTDLTTAINASIADVEFELVLTIALVVMVIFLFLRNVLATIIPSVAVPVSLVGTFAVMYALGYSLDNLSLMALTISTGFVVDDAIVMIENITRYIEEGEEPMAAALKGAEQIGFTIMSLTVSLIAVLIPLLFMGDVVGRLFREFAVTLSLTIVVSAVVSLTLTPTMAARFLPAAKDTHHGRLYALSERGFDALLKAYERGLDVVLKFRFITLLVFLATLALTVYLFVIIPQGFFPQQDTGLITGISQAAQDVSVKDMMRHQEALGAIVMKDPAIAHVAMAIGGAGNPSNTGRMFITLKRRDQRDVTADQVITRLQPQLAKVEGAQLFLQAAQDVTVGGRAARTQYQYTLQDSDFGELNQWAPKMLAKMQTLPELRDVASDQEVSGTTLTLTFDRDQASRYGLTAQTIDDTLYDAFGQREIAQYFTQLSSYEVILEVLPSLQEDLATLDKIFLKSSTGGEVPLSTFAKWSTTPVQPLAINHQGQFPATTISFNLAPGAALSQATDAIERIKNELKLPATVITSFQGNAQAFQDSLTSVPLLIVAALVVVYLILGILYESYIHPITILSTLPSAGVGALATLMLFHFDFSLIALVGIILLIGIVKKNGIMLVDFAITAEEDEHLAPQDAIRRAALLRFRPIMMTTMAAILGGVPLMLGTGTGSEIRQPLGYAMVGGLIVSQALTLFTTPVIYIYLGQFQNWLSSRRRPAEKAAAATVPSHAAVAE